jgi:hypothetical protein
MTTDADDGLRRRHARGDAEAAAEDARSEGAASSSAGTAGSSAVGSRASTATTAGGRPRERKGFVELLFSPLSFVLGDGEPEDPQAAARAFTRSLRRRYGEDVTPRFEHLSFRDAVSTARTASKFLLVFLHSNIHEDADAFCRCVACLCSVWT